ncbi:MAG: L-aspartate oxidase [Melioribacteraceae bacterium]|nr:L-aspartate oxidase [Melioribacteraceae bacterium]
MEYEFDVVIIGTGLAGLYTGFKAGRELKIAIITKTTLEESNSFWAQGGIAAALGEDDSTELHYKDTFIAGRDLCRPEAVRVLVEEGPKRVQELIDLGMPFDKVDGEIAFGLEGGHSRRRILHAGGGATGKELVNFTLGLVKTIPNIKVYENCFAHKIITENSLCKGVAVYNNVNGENIFLKADSVVIASGGASAIYSRTTNPESSTGEGVTLAYVVGAEIESMEFVQFHPTAFYSSDGKTFLISEAVRGEGAWLLDQKGNRFLEKYGITEVSPRDIVSKAIFSELADSKEKFVYLKTDHINHDLLKTRFEKIYLEALNFGIDITKDLIPIAPAAHYSIGGIKTNLNGETNIENLYAVGEVSSTGIHGANRLASNSLLECLVFGKRAVDSILKKKNISNEISNNSANKFILSKENKKSYLLLKNNIADLIWKYAGIVRSKESLATLIDELNDLSIINKYADEYYSFKSYSLIMNAKMTAEAALLREESRGGHYRSDYPNESDGFKKTIIQSKNNKIKFDE